MAQESAAVGIAALSSLDNLSVGVGYALKGEEIPYCANALVALINSAGMLSMMFIGQRLVRAMPSSLGSPERVGSVMAGIVYLGIGSWELLRLANVRFRPRKRKTNEPQETSDDALLLWETRPKLRQLARAAPDETPDETAREESDEDDAVIGRTPTVVCNFLMIAKLLGMAVVKRRHEPLDEEAKEPDKADTTMGFYEALVLGLALTGSNIAAGIAAGASGLDVPVTVCATFVCSFAFMLVGTRFGDALRRGATTRCSLSHNEVSIASAAIFLVYGAIVLATA